MGNWYIKSSGNLHCWMTGFILLSFVCLFCCFNLAAQREPGNSSPLRSSCQTLVFQKWQHFRISFSNHTFSFKIILVFDFKVQVSRTKATQKKTKEHLKHDLWPWLKLIYSLARTCFGSCQGKMAPVTYWWIQLCSDSRQLGKNTIHVKPISPLLRNSSPSLNSLIVYSIFWTKT